MRSATVLIGLIAAVVLAPAAMAGSRQREPQMKVLLSESSSIALRADGNQRLQVRGLPGGDQSLQRLRLQVRGTRLEAVLDGRAVSLPLGELLTVQNDDPRGIWLGQRRYRGVLRVSARGGRLRVVNAVGIETYLSSVVGSEMPHQWPLAALQAQAVAARTYALKQRSRGGGWDLKATVASQVYRGVESETPSTREAVSSTRSLVLVHGGRLIDAVFHSSSGGVTEASGMVWRLQHPYLVSVQDHDQHSPVHRWEEWFDPDGLRRRLPETGGLKQVQVLSRSMSGRVRQARLQGPRGTLVLSGAELRKRLGLKSTLVDFEMVTGARPTFRSPEPVIARAQVTGEGTGSRIDRITASVSAVTQPRRSRMSLVSPPPALSTGLQLRVRGQGYGHGVGMSQWGAHGLAQQGADFRTILQHYYRGASVVPYRSHHDASLALLPPATPVWKNSSGRPFGTVSLSASALPHQR